MVDQGQLEQALVNMAVNARDAMPNGGQLRIQTENFEMDAQAAGKYQYPCLRGPYVRLTISDDGVGMNSETLARAFEPFLPPRKREREPDWVSQWFYGFVKQSGGYIDLTSELGLGTSIRIYLPRVGRLVGKSEAVGHFQRVRCRKRTILLVEDDDPSGN